MSTSSLRSYFKGLSRNTYLLALASLFSDISTEMLYPIMPIYLTQTLKAGGSIVGVIDGIAQATQNIAQGFSGSISDRLQKRKSIALIGYLLAALSKPLIGVATIWQGVLGARFLDRLGAGTRSAPRDALIASSTDDQNRGKAFGLEGLGDNLGAFLGPLVCVFLLFSLGIAMRNIFFLALIPGLIAFGMIFLVKERAIQVRAKSILDPSIRQFPVSYWKYLFVVGLFGLGNSSNSFLILQTKHIGLSLMSTIIIYAFFNLIAALISYPSGYLSDVFGRKTILLISFCIFLVTYLGFALSTNVIIIGLLFILYGMYQGIFRSVGKAFVTDFVPAHQRAGGIGWYATTIGMSELIASIVAGLLWDKVGHGAVFFYGAGFALLGTIALLVFIPSTKPKMV